MNNADVETVLFVGSSRSEVMLAEIGYRKSGARPAWDSASGPDDGQRYLMRAKSGEAPMPRTLFLDLPNVPERDRFLEFVRSDSAFDGVGVIVLTTSGDAREQERALAMGADDVLLKSYDVDEVADVFRFLLSAPLAPSDPPARVDWDADEDTLDHAA